MTDDTDLRIGGRQRRQFAVRGVNRAVIDEDDLEGQPALQSRVDFSGQRTSISSLVLDGNNDGEFKLLHAAVIHGLLDAAK